MKIYIDVLLLINFTIDIIILLMTSFILKRRIKIYRLILSALMGCLSVTILFFEINNIVLFLIKILLCSFMVIISFKYKSFKFFCNNMFYFFMNSLMLGGIVYFINLKFKSVFIMDELAFNFIVFLIFSPIVLLIYTKKLINIKYQSSLKYKVDIYIDKKIFNLVGYYDTGNVLVDPYKKRSVLIVNNQKFKKLKLNYLIVPVSTIKGSFLLKCFKPDMVYIEGVGQIKNVLIGIMEENILMDGIDCLINKRIMEDVI